MKVTQIKRKKRRRRINNTKKAVRKPKVAEDKGKKIEAKNRHEILDQEKVILEQKKDNKALSGNLDVMWEKCVAADARDKTSKEEIDDSNDRENKISIELKKKSKKIEEWGETKECKEVVEIENEVVREDTEILKDEKRCKEKLMEYEKQIEKLNEDAERLIGAHEKLRCEKTCISVWCEELVENLKSEVLRMRHAANDNEQYFDADEMKEKINEEFNFKMTKEIFGDMSDEDMDSDSEADYDIESEEEPEDLLLRIFDD